MEAATATIAFSSPARVMIWRGRTPLRTRSMTRSPAVRATLDDLFRRAVAARPDALALIDPSRRRSDWLPQQVLNDRDVRDAPLAILLEASVDDGAY